MAQEPSVLDDRAAVQSSTEEVPIRSQVALEAYLRDRAGQPTPFDALPAGARERFLLNLGWGRNGLAGFDPGVLADELPQAQIDAILRLFGEEAARYAPRSRRLEADPASPASATKDISDLEQRYNALYKEMRRNDLDAQAFSALLVERFDALLAAAYAPASLRTIDDRHLAMLWNAAEWTSKQSNAWRHVTAMEAVFAEIIRRTSEAPPVYRLRALRDVLLAARRFEDAGRFLDRYPGAGLPPLPAFIDALKVPRLTPPGTLMRRASA